MHHQWSFGSVMTDLQNRREINSCWSHCCQFVAVLLTVKYKNTKIQNTKIENYKTKNIVTKYKKTKIRKWDRNRCSLGEWWWLVPMWSKCQVPNLHPTTRIPNSSYYSYYKNYGWQYLRNENSYERSTALVSQQPFLVSSKYDRIFGPDFQNIARGTTDPGYRVYNLSYLSS